MDETRSTPLVAAYFERRDELRRFFIARLGSAAEADDLVQDLFLKLSGVSPSEEIHNPGAYLYRLASNVMLDRLRRDRRAAARDGAWRSANSISAHGEEVAELPAADDAVAARQQLDRLVRALDDLTPQTQRIFRLHKFEGLSHAETAAKVGISRSAVEKHMITALKHLLAKVGRP